VLKEAKIRAGANPVVLQRDGQYVSVYPPVSGLADEITTVRHEPDPNDGRVLAVPYPLVWPQADRLGRRFLQTFAGLEPLLAAWLARHGHRVELTGNRPPELNNPDANQLPEFGGTPDWGLLDFVRRRERGLVRHGPAVDPARLVAQIALGWRRAHVLVLATRRRDAADFRDRLSAFVPRVSLFAGRSSATATRVVVATPGYARAGAVGIESRNVLVALNPDELFPVGELASPIDALRQARRARLYGLLRVGAEFPPHTRSLMTTLFGPDEVVVPRHGHVPRGVDVAFVRVEGGPRVRGHDPVRLVRSGVWQHPVRNRRLARLAGLIAAGQYANARKEYPQLAGVQPRRPGGRVVLLAANVEHALAVAGYLPDAPIACGGEVFPAGLSPEQAQLLKQRGVVGDARMVIATPIGLSGIGSIGVLVRADAGRGLPPIPEDHLVIPHGTKTRLLVVDAADRHHPALRVATRDRKAAYRATGWDVVGEPAVSPLDRFLADRPEVRA
jgi:hypothetical protein